MRIDFLLRPETPPASDVFGPVRSVYTLRGGVAFADGCGEQRGAAPGNVVRGAAAARHLFPAVRAQLNCLMAMLTERLRAFSERPFRRSVAPRAASRPW